MDKLHKIYNLLKLHNVKIINKIYAQTLTYTIELSQTIVKALFHPCSYLLDIVKIYQFLNRLARVERYLNGRCLLKCYTLDCFSGDMIEHSLLGNRTCF